MDPKFPEKLIKGKITEAIFEQMFRDQKEFEVLPNGYEYKSPEIAQNLLSLEHKEYLNKMRHAPDFVLLSFDRKKAFLVEVKYRSEIGQELMKEAEKLNESYRPCYLFVATPQGFYFDSCSNIVGNNQIERLSSSWISETLQDKYLELLNSFIK